MRLTSRTVGGVREIRSITRSAEPLAPPEETQGFRGTGEGIGGAGPTVAADQPPCTGLREGAVFGGTCPRQRTHTENSGM